MSATITYRSSFVTVIMNNELEIVAYGSEADWMVQLADITNHRWRKWFSSREKAEEFAMSELAGQSLDHMEKECALPQQQKSLAGLCTVLEAKDVFVRKDTMVYAVPDPVVDEPEQ